MKNVPWKCLMQEDLLMYKLKFSPEDLSTQCSTELKVKAILGHMFTIPATAETKA